MELMMVRIIDIIEEGQRLTMMVMETCILEVLSPFSLKIFQKSAFLLV